MSWLKELLIKMVENTKTFCELQRGKFLGEMQALRILTGEVGKDGMKMLAKWILDPNESIEIVQSLGLTEAQTKIQALRQGQDVQVMERIAPDIVHRQSARPKGLELKYGLRSKPKVARAENKRGRRPSVQIVRRLGVVSRRHL